MPAVLDAYLAEVELAAGADHRLDAFVAALRDDLADPDALEHRARRTVERLALALQGSLLVRHAPTAVADAFCAARLAGRRRALLRHAPQGRRRPGDRRPPHAARVMGGGGSIQLARILGIRIGASPSWFVVLFIMIWALSGYFRDALEGSSSTTAYVTAVAGAALFFISLLAHELGHAIVARRNGIGISGIDLWFFGGVAKMTRDTSTPGEEFRVAAAGPAVTLRRSSPSAWPSARRPTPSPRRATAPRRASCSTGWRSSTPSSSSSTWSPPSPSTAAGSPGRSPGRSPATAGAATRFSARLGQGFAYVLIGFGIFLLAAGSDPVNGLWFMVLGWFLGQAARGAVLTSRFTERLEGVTVADVMDTEPVWVPGDETAARVEDEFFARYRSPWFPVADPTSGHFHGLITAERVDAAIAGGQPEAPARDLVEPAAQGVERAVSVRARLARGAPPRLRAAAGPGGPHGGRRRRPSGGRRDPGPGPPRAHRCDVHALDLTPPGQSSTTGSAV